MQRSVNLNTVFDAVGSGAYDCLAKPLEVESILALLDRLREERDESEATVRRVPVPGNQEDVIVESSGAMIAAYRRAAAASRTQATVLIRGESGTSKELLARAAHDASGRTGPFVALNCAAIVDTLVESELFGYERGAFTGATERRPGSFETADGGTLFLDEIGDATSSFQAKLLRALDRGEFFRVGGRSAICPDVRIVAATNQLLQKNVEDEVFRADLFYRLTEVTIRLPPLRDRLGDIPILVRGLMRRIAQRLDVASTGISEDALATLARHEWPGNVREFQNVLTRAMIVERGAAIGTSALLGIDGVGEDRGHALIDVERQRVTRVLEATGWHRGKACDILGITRPTLRRKMKGFDIDRVWSGRTLRD